MTDVSTPFSASQTDTTLPSSFVINKGIFSGLFHPSHTIFFQIGTRYRSGDRNGLWRDLEGFFGSLWSMIVVSCVPNELVRS